MFEMYRPPGLTRWLLTLAVLSTAAPPALAQTFSLDRMRNQSEFGVRLDFGFPRDEGREVTTEETFFRAELHGQIAVADWGAYFALPFARNLTQLEGREEVTSLGNLEVGGFNTIHFSTMDLIVRFGVTLPTSDGSIASYATNAYSNYGRITDHVNVEPNALGLRMSASPVLDMGVVFLRADIGVDLVFDTADEKRNDFQSFFRANIGLGVNVGVVTVAVESANTITMADSEFTFGQEAGGRSLHTITAGTWLNFGMVHPYVAFSVPVDDYSRDTHGFVFTLGTEVRL